MLSRRRGVVEAAWRAASTSMRAATNSGTTIADGARVPSYASASRSHASRAARTGHGASEDKEKENGAKKSHERGGVSGGITRAGTSGRHRGDRDGHGDSAPAYRSRKSVDATTDVEWEGRTFTGSRLEYAGVEVRGELRWPIPLHALAEINPVLKELLEVAKTSDGKEERAMAERMSVLRASGELGRRETLSVVSTSSSGFGNMGGTNVRTMTPGLIEFEQFLVESGWRVDSERKAISRDVRDTLVSEAKKKTALKMKVNDAPMSKTMLSKVKVGDLRDAAKVLGLDQVMQGVTKKADVVAYLLAYYEYMHGTIDAKTMGVRMSDVSSISAEIMREAEKDSNATSASARSAKVSKPELKRETDPGRMDYVKAFEPDELVQLLVRARGIDVMSINVRDQCTWTDHLIIATARSAHHLKALAGAVLHAVKARTEYVAGGRLQPVIEGAQNGGDKDWMAVDCGSCMVHIFSPEGRAQYNLEELWATGEEIVHNGPERLSIDTIGADHHTA